MRRACLVMGLAAVLAVRLGGRESQDLLAPAAVARDIEQDLTAARVPGAAIAVVSGSERFAGSYGVASADAKTPMTPATLLQAGSVTKLFTALAVSISLETRQVPFDTPVGRHLTRLAPEIARLTYHQLLAQTSGLRDRPGTTGSDDEAALAAAARALGPSDAILPPGTVFSYSNPGYGLAGAALEALQRQPFADALTDTVLAPLGMTASTLRPAAARAKPQAAGHRLDGGALVTLPTPANDTRIWPAGYLWSNATDLSLALTALLNEGRVPGSQGLPASAVRRISQPHTPMPNVFVDGDYGYGVMIARDRGALIYEHGGTMPGFSAIIRLAPERRLGVAILANLDSAPLRRVAQAAMAKALGLSNAAPPARSETPVTPEEMKTFLGRYENRGTADLVAQDGRVALSLDGGPAMAVTRIGEDRYLARPKPDVPGPEFVLRTAANGTPYLHFALWAYGKQ